MGNAMDGNAIARSSHMALPLTDEPMVDTAGLPAGVAMRPFAGDEDLRVFVEIANAANAEDRVEERTSFDALRNWVGHPSRTFDAAQDVAVVTVDDKPIAYGWTTWVDSSDGVRDYSTRGHVHPAWRRRGHRHRHPAPQRGPPAAPRGGARDGSAPLLHRLRARYAGWAPWRC